ncbi:branched-chain amino acid transport system II carrier protein [Eupransor demetentiae]|uniref:Branched-chain amino acid transport system carrier protein n=1 Tax=Eupransor demetentiae TaxID=3109584 RepID=A0ABM9N3Z0_9LACO|nr:Branched-chain amino acid permease (BrnQ) [Lactobacillaceae bacterium LMG 33000]
MKEHKLTIRELILLASVIFGMFFGAANLIFPVQLGQAAGNHWVPALIGFLVTGTIVPFLAMLAVSLTNSKSIYDLAAPVAPWFGLAVLIAVHFTLGPLAATPRSAATAFEMGIAPLLKKSDQPLAMLIFSAIYFIALYFSTLKQSRLIKLIGKYLNPLFLIFLAVILILAFVLPMGNVHHASQALYQSQPLLNGILDGYNTLDGLCLLGLTISIVYTTKNLGFHDKAIPKALAQAGLLSIILEAVLYAALVWLGVTSLGSIPLAENGGIAFGQIIGHYLGNLGILFTGILVVLAVFTTAMGLSASFGQDLHRAFPKIPYSVWLAVVTGGSFITANAGLTNIIKFTVPIVRLLYPLALVLIILGLFNHWIKQSPIIYRAGIILVVPEAILDFLIASPFHNLGFVQDATKFYYQFIPFAEQGFGWFVPAVIGITIGIIWQHSKGKLA